MVREGLNFVKIRATRDALVESLRKWISEDGFYRSAPLTKKSITPSFTNTGLVLQAFNECGDRASAQTLANRLLAYLEQRQFAPFPQEKVDGNPKPHVLNNSWVIFALLDCYPAKFNLLKPLCEWFLGNQREDFGWDLIYNERSDYPAVDAYALRTLIKYYTISKRVGIDDRAFHGELSRAIRNGIDRLEHIRHEVGKENNLYLWPASLEDEAARSRISFGTSTLCMHVIAKGAKALERGEWDGNVVRTLKQLCSEFRDVEHNHVQISKYRVAIWDTIAINESSLNYTWSFFAPLSLTTLLAYVKELKETEGYLDVVSYFSSWILNNTERVAAGVGVRGSENTQGVKTWSTAEAVISLSRLLKMSDQIFEIDQPGMIPIVRLSQVLSLAHKRKPGKRWSLIVTGMLLVLGIIVWLALRGFVMGNWDKTEPLWTLTGFIIAALVVLLGFDVKGIRERVVAFLMQTWRNRQIVSEIEQLIQTEQGQLKEKNTNGKR
jgi:hypothetical protein